MARLELLRLAAFHALLATPIAAVLGPSWRRQLALALAALTFVGVTYGYGYTVGCHPGADTCGPVLGLIVGAVTMIGWLGGIGLGVALRGMLRALT